jgi:hypothetical protein
MDKPMILRHNFVDGGNDFSGTWSNSHTYAGSGEYTVTVTLYHGEPGGSEASDSALIIIPVVIPPTGTLNVIKTVVNDDGGTNVAGDFTMNVTGTDVSNPTFQGDASGTAVSRLAHIADESAFRDIPNL